MYRPRQETEKCPLSIHFYWVNTTPPFSPRCVNLLGFSETGYTQSLISKSKYWVPQNTVCLMHFFFVLFLGVQPFPTNCVFSIQKSDVTLTSIWPDRHKLSNNNHTFVLFVSMFWLHAFWRTALENVCTHHNTKGHFFRCTSAM